MSWRQVFVFLQMNRPLHAMEIMAICDDIEHRVRTFDVQVDLVKTQSRAGSFSKDVD